MAKQADDVVYMSMAVERATASYALRKRVGALAVKDRQIISDGYNGTSSGDSNVCEEHVMVDGVLTTVTKSSVIHAEKNMILKAARNGGGLAGSESYQTLSPCPNCASDLHACGFTKIIYLEEYRDPSGIEWLRERGILVQRLQADAKTIDRLIARVNDLEN